MSYSAWKSANSAKNLAGKQVLIIGGTQGIGAGVALRFSQIGASVVVAGRNEVLGNQVVETMNKEKGSSSAEFKFLKVDASSIQDMDRFTKEAKTYFESKGGLDYLVQSQGILNSPFHSRSNTSEGMDLHFMTNAYSKWFITERLIPVIKDTVIYIFAPATHGEINFDDVELKKTSPSRGPTIRDTTFTDAITMEFQNRHPKLRFYHLFPYVVKTDIMKNGGFGVVLNKVMGVLSAPFSRTPIEYADWPVYVATHPEELKDKPHRLSEKGKPYADYDWIKNSSNLQKLFAWNENTANAHSSTSSTVVQNIES